MRGTKQHYGCHHTLEITSDMPEEFLVFGIGHRISDICPQLLPIMGEIHNVSSIQKLPILGATSNHCLISGDGNSERWSVCFELDVILTCFAESSIDYSTHSDSVSLSLWAWHIYLHAMNYVCERPDERTRLTRLRRGHPKRRCSRRCAFIRCRCFRWRAC